LTSIGREISIWLALVYLKIHASFVIHYYIVYLYYFSWIKVWVDRRAHSECVEAIRCAIKPDFFFICKELVRYQPTGKFTGRVLLDNLTIWKERESTLLPCNLGTRAINSMSQWTMQGLSGQAQYKPKHQLYSPSVNFGLYMLKPLFSINKVNTLMNDYFFFRHIKAWTVTVSFLQRSFQ
jgi:hypothetical protein